MSTIRADYISPSAGGTSKSLVRGTASAWVNFNGTGGTIAPRDSLNVSGLTDNGTGDYTVNLTNAFGAVDYKSAKGGSWFAAIYSHTNASSIRMETYNSAVAATDVALVCADAHGDLA